MKCWMWIVFFISYTGLSIQYPDGEGSYSVKICSGQFLDQSQHSPCPLGTGINVSSITFGVRERDVSCTQFPSSLTCVRQMEAIYPDEFEAWKQTCDGKIVCDNQRAAPALPVSCDGRSANSDFIKIMFECVLSPAAIRITSTCVGDYITDLTCPHGYRITITGIYLADNPQLGTCEAGQTTYSCALSITSDKSLSLWHNLVTSCHNKATCSELVVAEAVRDSQCATVKNVVTDYVILQYICVSDVRYTHRCHGYTFDDLFCAAHEVLRIISVTYGDTEQTLTDEQCRGGAVDNPCYATRTTSYTKSVFKDCDGEVSCSHQVSITGTLGACFRNREMQFVEISFQCAHISQVPSIPSTTNYAESKSPSTTTPTGTTQTETSGTSGPDARPGQTHRTSRTSVMTVAVSVAAAGGVVVAIVVVTTICVRRRKPKKNSGPSQEHDYVNMTDAAGPETSPPSEGTETSTPNTHNSAPGGDPTDYETIEMAGEIRNFPNTSGYGNVDAATDEYLTTNRDNITAEYVNDVITGSQPITGSIEYEAVTGVASSVQNSVYTQLRIQN